MEERKIEEVFDLSIISREKLFHLLSCAKDEVEKWSRCYVKAEKVRKPLKEAKKTISKKYNPIGLIIFASCLAGVLFSSLFGVYDNFFWYIVTLVGFFTFIFTFAVSIVFLRERKEAKRAVLEYEEQLFDLEREEREAKNDFKALLFIPNNYCTKNALTKMLEFVENKRADNWKEVTNLYEDYLYKQEMKGIAQQTLEQSTMQTDLANETRNSARWAAAGAWASAAGIWRR